MAPVCIGCGLAMQPLKNGVMVEEMADFGGYRLWQADAWKCPACDNRVVVGFSRTPFSEHWMPNWNAEIEANPDRIRFWGTLAEFQRYNADDWQPPGCVIDSIVDDAIATARAQAASATAPQKAELLESLRTAERASSLPLSAGNLRVWDRAHDELAHEEAENRIIVAREGSL